VTPGHYERAGGASFAASFVPQAAGDRNHEAEDERDAQVPSVR
jgi:hypothetical protein